MLLYRSLRAFHAPVSSKRLYMSAQLNFYQVLELLPRASLKEIKTQFKRLLKKYHPDLNAHLSEEDKVSNNKKFVEMVLAYDTLKDKKKRKSYDATLLPGLRGDSSVYSRWPASSDWESTYFGSAKHYSRARASGVYTSHGYYYSRFKVRTSHRGQKPDLGSQHFTGEHKNKSDRFDVPHFDYNEHLSKHLKFEQRIISRDLSEADKEAVLRQLAPDGDLSKVNEELITKHLMRQAKCQSFPIEEPSTNHPTAERNPYMYHGPQDGGHDSHESSVGFAAFMVAGGAGSAYLLYHLILV